MNNMRSFFDISEKVVVVTGAAGQLGGEYVKTFLAAGGLVAAFDINLSNPKGILKDISSKNGRGVVAITGEEDPYCPD